jgi:PAS domain S-box-containing protein
LDEKSDHLDDPATSTQLRSAIRLTEAQLTDILNNMSDALFAVDQHWTILLVNRKWEQLVGRYRDGMLGKNLWQAFPHAVETVVYGELLAVMQTRREGKVEYYSEFLERWIDLRAYPSGEGIVAYFADITERKRGEVERARLTEQLQNLSRRLLEVQEAERRAVAVDLHNEIGQQLIGLALLLSTIDQRLPPESTRERVETAQVHLRALIEHVRHLALDLRPSVLDDFGLIPALTELFGRYTTQTKIAAYFEHADLAERRFAPEVEITVYRIVQEALTNVARHAGVDKVIVWLQTDGEALIVTIEDAGCGFDAQVVATRPSIGLGGMNERAALAGGRLSVVTKPAHGTTVQAHIPLRTATRADEAAVD